MPADLVAADGGGFLSAGRKGLSAARGDTNRPFGCDAADTGRKRQPGDRRLALDDAALPVGHADARGDGWALITGHHDLSRIISMVAGASL